jgi:hypothetical protein
MSDGSASPRKMLATSFSLTTPINNAAKPTRTNRIANVYISHAAVSFFLVASSITSFARWIKPRNSLQTEVSYFSGINNISVHEYTAAALAFPD